MILQKKHLIGVILSNICR